MEPAVVLEAARSAVWTALLVAAPVLVAALVVGLLISLFQVVTQVQEMTLTFVPKILAVAAVLLILGHWMLATLVDFAVALYQSIPQ